MNLERDKTFEMLGRVLDAFLLALCFGALNWRFAGRLEVGHASSAFALPEYKLLLFAGVAIWLVVDKYRAPLLAQARSFFSTTRHLVQVLILWVIGTGFMVFSLKLRVSREFTYSFFALGAIAVTVRQLLTLALLHSPRLGVFNARRAIIFGDGDRAGRLAELLEGHKGCDYKVYRIFEQWKFDDEALPESVEDAFILLAGNNQLDVEMLSLRLIKEGCRVHLVPSLLDAKLFRQSLGELSGVPVLSIGGWGMDRLECAVKRSVDIIGSVAALVVLSPILAAVAMAVKLTSSGPIFFVQDRLGLYGQRFRIYKFRTMHADAEQRLSADAELYRKYVANNYKLPKEEDPRISPIGSLLRSTSLDELPQLFNVFRGDMSLVGPRPVVPPEIEEYGDYAKLLLSVKPGLTGYWQVNGRSEITSYDARARLDIEYVRDQSFKTDVDVLFKTIPAVLKRRGAF
jgi:exopolysaccharide biosynthesis polyprenyl glycosylphosphotransferase